MYIWLFQPTLLRNPSSLYGSFLKAEPKFIFFFFFDVYTTDTQREREDERIEISPSPEQITHNYSSLSFFLYYKYVLY